MSRLNALLQLQTLDLMPRTGWIQHRIAAPETVGAHCLGTAFVVLSLGQAVEPPVDVDRAVTLALLHDAGEVLIGDIPAPSAELFPPGAKATAERAAAEQVLGPLSALALERGLEALDGETREARFVHLCDRLQLGVRLNSYLAGGVRGLDRFRAGLERLDCSEFEVCDELRREILTAIDAIG